MKFYLVVITAAALLNASCKKENTGSPTPQPVSDSFNVNINNGYGSGKFKTGDTVHIWSKEYPAGQIFNSWTGDIAVLNSNDWHTWFIMPANNEVLTATFKTAPVFTLNYEEIMGRDRLKPVYYFFPANNKGIVYLLHGSGGSAEQIQSTFEARHIIKELVTDGYGVIITEAEEATTGLDINSDGKLRWQLTPADTLANIDYINIRLITEDFYNRNIISRNKPRFSIGMSNGGAFSATLSNVYKFKAAISYCAQTGALFAATSTTPLQFCMQKYDDNENVGSAGNAEALNNSNTLAGRGVCSKYYANIHSPLYPERFARRTDIPIATSTAIYEEIKAAGYLDSKNYFTGSTTALVNSLQSNPAQYPVIISLPLDKILFIIEQLNCCIANHQFFSDYTKRSLKFLNTQCQ